MLDYIITANCMPLLDAILGVDPATWDLEPAKARLGGKVCLWGGVHGHLTVERGRAEVRRAMQVLALGGGFILSPVDNVRQYTPTARGTWRRWSMNGDDSPEPISKQTKL
jgi:hypothetical protein